ncbi:MAG: GspE/PulE family protein [Candidatus Paceibacterota bacterium]|jgi:type IV pilus assembly protein PilB
MTDQQLFQEFVKRNIISQAIAETTLQEASLSGKVAEDILFEKKIADEIAIAKVKGELFGAPYKKANVAIISEDLLKAISKEVSMTYRVMPMERVKDMLVIGMFRPDDVRAQEALRFIAKQQGVSLGVYVVTLSDLALMWRRYMPYASEIEAAVKEVGAAKADDGMVDLESAAKGEEAPVIKIVASTLRQAVDIGASDIHIEPQRNKLRIRFRMDGVLHEVVSLPPNLIQPVVSRIKVLARLKLDETRVPQDGRFRTNFSGREIDYRVATFPTPSGEKVAIRVLDPKTGLKGLDQLGLSAYNAAILDEGLKRPYGMILISGPTGSGKSTTLYAIMQRLNSEAANTVTLEDPVEYFMEGVNQSQVRPEINYSFASGLRQILRQDPDVIMVGEIRDAETANLAVNAALTGHTMLSTIHTNNAVGVIPRFVDLGVPTFLLSSALNIIIAQRLVLRLCPECRVGDVAPADIEQIIEQNIKLLPASLKKSLSFSAPYTIFRPGKKSDCKTCKGRGTSGRVALYEILKMTRELGDLFNKGFTEGSLLDEARRQGIVMMRQDGILKALEGMISIEEVLRETTE